MVELRGKTGDEYLEAHNEDYLRVHDYISHKLVVAFTSDDAEQVSVDECYIWANDEEMDGDDLKYADATLQTFIDQNIIRIEDGVVKKGPQYTKIV